MAVTLPKPLVRTTYLKNFEAGSNGDPNSPNYDPTSAPVRIPPPSSVDPHTSHAESNVDMELYVRPLEQLHGMTAHGAGICAGLEVAATVGATGLRVGAGVALDPAGRHIYLAAGGKAGTGKTGTTPPTPSEFVAMTNGAFLVPTSGPAGDYVVTIQWWETFDNALFVNSNRTICQFNHTPWLRLTETPNADTQIVLAKVRLDSDGKVLELGPGDDDNAQRSGLGVVAQRVDLMRASASAGPRVGTVAAGALSGRNAGGLRLSVLNEDDRVEIARDSEDGRFAQMTVAADQTTFGPADRPGIVLDAAHAQCLVGTDGAAGQVVLHDPQGKPSLQLNGASGTAALARIEPIADQGAVQIGAASLVLEGALQGANGQALAVAGGLTVAKDLVVNGLLMDGRRNPLVGNPARKVMFNTQTASAGQRNTFDVDLQSARRFTAICIATACQSTANGAAFAVEVFQVDGAQTILVAEFNGMQFFSPCVSQVGRVIKFRVSALGQTDFVGALGLVFYE